MLLWKFSSVVFSKLTYFINRAVGILSLISHSLIRKYPFALDKTSNVDASGTSRIIQGSSNCITYTVRPQLQRGLERIGSGAAGHVYQVDDSIVLKTCRIYERPDSNAPQREQLNYASDTIFHSNLSQNARTVLGILQKRPHRHAIEAIDTNQPEGVYLRRYRPFQADKDRSIPAQPQRIQWYVGIVNALCHIHSLGIVHADLRIDNFFFDQYGAVILSDFSAATPVGYPSLVFPDLPLPINGPSSILSHATDIFAMGSLIFHLEHGAKPALRMENESLMLPEIRTGHQGLDRIIRAAWLGQYNHTSEMLKELDAVAGQRTDCIPVSSYPSEECLRDRIREWRTAREDKYGSVLKGILSVDELQDLANCFYLDKDADLRFAGVPWHHDQTSVQYLSESG